MFFTRRKNNNRGVRGILGKLTGAGIPEEAIEELEEMLLASDIGARTVDDIVEAVRTEVNRTKNPDELLRVAASIIKARVESRIPDIQADGLHVFLVLGVNGVGKTTSIAKMAHWYRKHQGIDNIVLAAGDTFRAAAVQQLQLHGERLGIRVVAQGNGSDAAAVIYDALASAQARGDRLLIADTAGRMHNKKHLVEELAKIQRIISRQSPEAHVHRILVLDATTGQNALRQAEVFHEAVGVDYVILSKYDSSARAGIAVSLCRTLNIPVAFLGTGESYDDISPLNIPEYVEGLLA
ncbi:signal recognition particle-docking protein FtsY [Spirochaeta dissipatitropha]